VNRLDRVELDIDSRLLLVWSEVTTNGPVDWELFCSCVRLAYAVGYGDCLREGNEGKLFTDYGYAVPKRRDA
jgi:hypothetical protein